MYTEESTDAPASSAPIHGTGEAQGVGQSGMYRYAPSARLSEFYSICSLPLDTTPANEVITCPTPTQAEAHRRKQLDSVGTPDVLEDGSPNGVPILRFPDGTYRRLDKHPMAGAYQVAVGQVMGRTIGNVDRVIRDGEGFIVVTLIPADRRKVNAKKLQSFFQRAYALWISAEAVDAERRLISRMGLNSAEKSVVERVRALALVPESDRVTRREVGVLVEEVRSC